jgi:hypothetical protein
VRVPLRRKAFVAMVLGFIWGVLLLVAVNINGFALVVLLLPAGVLAGLSVARSCPSAPVMARLRSQPASRDRGNRGVGSGLLSSDNYPLAVGIGAAVVCPLAGLAGPKPVFLSAALFALLGAVLLVRAPGGAPFAVLLSVAVCLPALGTGSVVAASYQGSNEGFALVAALCAYDVGSFLMGHARGAVGGPLGVAGGVLSVAVVAVAAAAVLDPPFAGNRPWVMFGMVAVLAPLGVYVLDLLVGARRMPAVRRVDSFVLAAPAWVAALPFVLHH